MNNSLSATKRITYRAFGDFGAYLDDLYEVYKDIYKSAPHFAYEETLTDHNSFEYCLARKFFILVVPYTVNRELLVERSFANNMISWVLVGGSLRADLRETFIDSAARHARNYMDNLELGEIEPIAFLSNTFSYQDDVHQHLGIAFAARIRNIEPEQDLQTAVHDKGFLIPYDNLETQFSLTHNESVVDVARQYLLKRDLTSTAEFEIAENIKYRNRYILHEKIFKPLIKFLGSYSFQYSLQELQTRIMQIAVQDKHQTFLDVACGENRTVFDVVQLDKAELVVGNDVSWSQVQLLSDRLDITDFRNIESFLLFTNHDARYMPFTDRFFDFVLCKNVLHHMADVESVTQLLNEIVRVSKRALVVEIMDPKFESLWGRVRHQYYVKFLRDAGQNFLSREEFADLTNLVQRHESFDMPTIRGIYQFAVFHNDSQA